MQLSAILGLVFTVWITTVVAQGPGDCNECRSPTGCPGLCAQSNGASFCKGYCGSSGMSPCNACAGYDGDMNCYYDASGENCYLEDP